MNAQVCSTLCNPMTCSLPGFSVHGIFQVIIPQWVAIPFSRGHSWPRYQTPVSSVSCISGRFFTEPSGKPSTPGNFPNQGLNLYLLHIASIAGRFFTAEPLGKTHIHIYLSNYLPIYKHTHNTKNILNHKNKFCHLHHHGCI